MNKYETPILELMKFGEVDIVTDSLGTETPPTDIEGGWEL